MLDFWHVHLIVDNHASLSEILAHLTCVQKPTVCGRKNRGHVLLEAGAKAPL